MPSRRSLLTLCLAIPCAAGWLSACGPEVISSPATALAPATARASQGSDDSDPTFLTAAQGAPSIANPVIVFWAKKGVDKRVWMYYHARPGHTDSTRFIEFRVRDKSLKTRPDGTPIANGDSIQITVTLVDTVNLKLDFQPSGLVFSSHDPAVLKLKFSETVRDLNGDGVVDYQDLAIQQTFRIWRRESPLDPWEPLSSIVQNGLDEVQADILGFTGYAAAY